MRELTMGEIDDVCGGGMYDDVNTGDFVLLVAFSVATGLAWTGGPVTGIPMSLAFASHINSMLK